MCSLCNFFGISPIKSVCNFEFDFRDDDCTYIGFNFHPKFGEMVSDGMLQWHQETGIRKQVSKKLRGDPRLSTKSMLGKHHSEETKQKLRVAACNPFSELEKKRMYELFELGETPKKTATILNRSYNNIRIHYNRWKQ